MSHRASRLDSLQASREITVADNNNPPEEEMVERILKATDPNAMSVPVLFDYRKEARNFKLAPSVGTVVVHFASDGVSIRKTSAEAVQQEEDRDRRNHDVRVAALAELNPDLLEDGVSTSILKNQFNYSDRGSQTMNQIMKERTVLTDPPPSASFGAMASAWAIYDAYEEERIQLEKQAEQQRKHRAQEKGKAEPGANTANIREENTTGTVSADDILASSSYRSALKAMERMVNQNDCFDIIDDFKYWEDQSDLYKEDGTLLPLWQFFTEKTKKRAVTHIALNKRYKDFFAVGYGSYDFQKSGKGAVLCYTMKNAVPTASGGVPLPASPEFSFFTESGVLCLAFHPVESSLLACGLYDGSVCVFDLRVKNEKQRVQPLYQANVRTGKHLDPVWEIYWKESTTELSFYSISTDGRIANWVLTKKELTSKDVLKLTTGECISDPEAMIMNQLGGMCMDYSPVHDRLVVGTQEGHVMLCTYSGQCVERYEGHQMAVYTVRWNAFHPNIFVTCSGDWTVKVWLRSSTKPLLTFDLGDSVGDVAWAPYSSSVLAAVTSSGKVCIFDLHKNKNEPLCMQTVVKNAQLTRVVFSHVDPIVLVGDTRGTVLTLKLSPNLRVITKPKKGEPDDPASIRALEKEKLTRLIDITMKDWALLGA